MRKSFFFLRVYEVALGGMEVLLLHFSQAELAWIAGKPEEIWSPAHLAMPTMEGISLKTKPRRSWTVHLHNRAAEQRTQDGTSSLDGGRPQTESALWVMGYKRDLFLWWDVETGQTVRMSLVSLQSLSCRQVHRCIRQNQATGFSMSVKYVKLIL